MGMQPKTSQPEAFKPIVWAAILIGALQGFMGWITYALGSDNTSEPIYTALFYCVLGGGLCAQLLLKKPPGLHQLLAVSGAAAAFGMMAWWGLYQLDTSEEAARYQRSSLQFSLFMFQLLFAYILIPYLQNWCNQTVKNFDYHDLYRHSWDNFFIVSIGILLSGIFWLLIVLWVTLFNMINIPFFKLIFYSAVFIWISCFAVAGLGITIGISNEKIIDSLRNIALAICKFMMPLTALITIIFTATLPFTGLQAIWDTKHSTPILLMLMAANVFFINGIFQNGAESNYPNPLKKFSNLSLLMLPILTVIAAYSTWLRIDQYGLTPDRIYSSLIILVTACYSFSYAFSAIQRNTQWLINIRKPNIYTGILICTLIALTHSPVLDPMTLSAKNQYSRLINNKISVAKFDFGALRYELGKPGLVYLQKIRTLQQHEHLAAIQEKLEILDETKDHFEWSQYQRGGEPKKATVLEALGDGDLPAELAEKIIRSTYSSYRSITIYFLIKDINNDNQSEVIVWEKHNDSVDTNASVWGLENGAWRNIGNYNNRFTSAIDIKQLSKEHEAELQVPAYQDLKIGDVKWRFIKNTSD